MILSPSFYVYQGKGNPADDEMTYLKNITCAGKIKMLSNNAFPGENQDA